MTCKASERFRQAIGIVAVLGCVFAGAACSVEPTQDRRAERTATGTAAQTPAEPPIPIKVGMTWDDCQPILSKAKRVKLTRETQDRFTDIYRIGDQRYSLIFERPSEPASGPYRLVHIERAGLPRDAGQVDLSRQLKRGIAMSEALPIMQSVGGHFVIETRDRYVAVLQASDGTYRVTFERPRNGGRPKVIADATPSVIAMMGQIPLSALPEFGAYRLIDVKKLATSGDRSETSIRSAASARPNRERNRVADQRAASRPGRSGAEDNVVDPSLPGADHPLRVVPATEPLASVAPTTMEPVRVGGNIETPTKVLDVKPTYPPIAQAARVQGPVILEATIGVDGKVRNARVLRSIPLLDEAALNAVNQWQFTPTLVDGTPVPVIMTLTVQFTLP